MVDAPPEAGGIPYRLEIHPSGRFVYVTNRMGLSLSVYNVDAETGVLTSLKSSPVKTGGKPYGVTAHPSGKFVYVTSQDTRTVWGYRINQDNGELTPLSDSPYSSHGAGPLSITFNTAGNRAYVTNVASNSIAQFSVNTGTGSLSLVETIRTRYEPFYIVLLETEPVNIPSRFDYLTKGENGQLTIQRLNALKGEGLPENPAREKNLPRQLPHSAAIEPRGRFVYTTYDAGDESDKSGIASYRIDSGSGKLVPLPENILSLGFVPTHMAINVSGRLLYAVNPSVNSIGIFTIDPESGALSPVKGQLPTTGEGPVTIALDPVGRFSFVANSRSDTVSVFTHIRMFSPAMYPINRSGSNFAVGDNPVALAVDPTGKFLVVANKDSNNLSVFSIHFHKGQLEAVKGSPFPSGNAPVSVAMHPSGKFVYVLNADSGDISSYRLDPLKGGLSVLSRRVNAGKRPVSMMLDSEGRFAYVKNKGTNGLRKYTVDSESGLLTFSGELDRGSKVTFVH
jgi:6-phosphogluconolactonase (cycloisomerase 2 family)